MYIEQVVVWSYCNNVHDENIMQYELLVSVSDY